MLLTACTCINCYLELHNQRVFRGKKTFISRNHTFLFAFWRSARVWWLSCATPEFGTALIKISSNSKQIPAMTTTRALIYKRRWTELTWDNRGLWDRPGQTATTDAVQYQLPSVAVMSFTAWNLQWSFFKQSNSYLGRVIIWTTSDTHRVLKLIGFLEPWQLD